MSEVESTTAQAEILREVRLDEQARIIELLEAECDCAFYEKYGIPSKCHAHKHIALIKGEN